VPRRAVRVDNRGDSLHELCGSLLLCCRGLGVHALCRWYDVGCRVLVLQLPMSRGHLYQRCHWKHVHELSGRLLFCLRSLIMYRLPTRELRFLLGHCGMHSVRRRLLRFEHWLDHVHGLPVGQVLYPRFVELHELCCRVLQLCSVVKLQRGVRSWNVRRCWIQHVFDLPGWLHLDRCCGLLFNLRGWFVLGAR
jgi:hypothetical protein